MLAVIAALGSALLVAVASVLQHRAGHSAPEVRLRHVLLRPAWIGGSAAGLAGFALHVVALSHGALSVVQALLVTALLFALPISHILDRRPVQLADLAAAGAVIGGLVLFQQTAHPASGRAAGESTPLFLSATVSALLIGVVLVAGWRSARYRAVWLGLAAGAAYGVVAALLKSTLGTLSQHGVTGLFAAWPPYGFVVLVCAAIIVNQLAFNAGPLAQSLPLITIADPVVSVALGAFAFRETVSGTPGAVLGQILSFLGMSVGVVVLCRRNQPLPTSDRRPISHPSQGTSPPTSAVDGIHERCRADDGAGPGSTTSSTPGNDDQLAADPWSSSARMRTRDRKFDPSDEAPQGSAPYGWR